MGSCGKGKGGAIVRILMFGWEFPPHVSGGLGTACEGMTRALAQMGHEIVFVLPGLERPETASHVCLVSSGTVELPSTAPTVDQGLSIRTIDSPLRPYLNDTQYQSLMNGRGAFPDNSYLATPGGYGETLLAEVIRYGQAGGEIAARETFDVIHGHDWMSVPAGLAARQRSGRPFVLHIHALEVDRSGEGVNQRIFHIERQGMEEADAVIAVSFYTRNTVIHRYGIDPGKVFVVHNAVRRSEGPAAYRPQKVAGEKIVLFLGRITFQKGPDYFIEAARLVLQEMPETTFVMAGSGDMMPRMVERVAELGLGSRFHFTGFLRGAEVEQMYAKSDLYVMPSVSEPFGISPLDAMLYDVPVIVSRQSGVAEVLHHALKVDFWDVKALADRMIAVLKYPPLAGELVENAREELKQIHWEKAAERIASVYGSVTSTGQA